MPELIPEFETWEDFNDFLLKAESLELHSLAVKHADCWSNQELCEEEEMLWDEGDHLDEVVFIRVVGAQNVSEQTLKFILECGSPNTEWRAALSFAIMSSPAITSEILTLIPVDDYVNDGEVAFEMFFHRLANLDVISHITSDGLGISDIVDRVAAERFGAVGLESDWHQRNTYRQDVLLRMQEKWDEVSKEGRVPSQDEIDSIPEVISYLLTKSAE
jgi:hypothetical protein